jgi:hypothetical protein
MDNHAQCLIKFLPGPITIVFVPLEDVILSCRSDGQHNKNHNLHKEVLFEILLNQGQGFRNK